MIIIIVKKTDAEVKQIEASARLIDAQAEKEKAEAEKVRAEAALYTAQAQKTKSEITASRENFMQVYMMPSGKTNIQEDMEQEALSVADDAEVQVAVCQIDKCAGKVCLAASKCGLTYNGQKIQRIR